MNNTYLEAAQRVDSGAATYACWAIQAVGGRAGGIQDFCAMFNTHNMGPAFFKYDPDGTRVDYEESKQRRVLALLLMHWIHEPNL